MNFEMNDQKGLVGGTPASWNKEFCVIIVRVESLDDVILFS